jgi:RHS repeat-associated protein
VPYSYNNLGQLEGMPGWIEGSLTYTLDGLLERYAASNQVSRSQVYDQNNRLTELHYQAPSGELKRFLMVYDPANNILRRNSSSFVYDELNRLLFAELYGSFQIDVSGRPQRVGRTVEDYSGEEALSFPVQEVDIALDSQATSIGVDLQASYRLHRIEINPLAAAHRLFEGALSVHAAEDNQEGAYRKIEGWSLAKDGQGRVKILLGEPVRARYLKVHCYYDDRDEENRFRDIATVRNKAEELLKVYYLIDWRTERYTYDPKGNRLQSSVSLEETKERSYTYYSGSDRLKSDGHWGYAYDPNGNLTAKGTAWVEQADGTLTFDPLGGAYWEYGYDLWNRLVEVRKADPASGQLAVVASYTYDADGLRLRKESPSEGDTLYLFSTNGVLLYREKAEVGRFEEYLYAFNNLFAVESGQVEGGEEQRHYILTDQLGSTVMITDAEGRVLWQDELTPFGESSGAIGLIEELARFTGKELDAETGLYYFNARWYDPELGRFITEDPAQVGLAWYIYARNNPLAYIDPTGLQERLALSRPSLPGDILPIFQVVDTGSTAADIALGGLAGIWNIAASAVNLPFNAFVAADTIYTDVTGGGLLTDQGLSGDLELIFMSTMVLAPEYAMAKASISAIRSLGTSGMAKLLGQGKAAEAGTRGAIPELKTGDKVFRVYGGDSPAGGASWTTANPADVLNFRDAAGLPSGGASGATNTGRFIIEGTVQDPSKMVLSRRALPLDGTTGGLPEYIFPNWRENGAIRVDRVMGVNPEF